jgi:L-lactate dehydrogenase complex protein LldG
MRDQATLQARIREALEDAAGAPEASRAFRDFMPDGGGTHEEQVALFAAQATALRADFRVMASPDEFRAFVASAGWRRIASHRSPLIESALAGQTVLWTDEGYDRTALESCDVGITGCDALIAQTGGVLVTARSCGGRGLSVLVPHHVVLARPEQLVPDLSAAFALLSSRYGASLPSSISFITGPSRTGDIERILVLGAHGPARLTIVLLNEP